MIGVLSKNSEIWAVQEFFQLFKTPWEVYVPHHSYDVVITTCEEVPENLSVRALVVYSSVQTAIDDQIGVRAASTRRRDWVNWQGTHLPVYGDLAVFQGSGQPLINRRGTSETVGACIGGPERLIVRVGYDLFWEVQFLLSQGQPAENAHIPTLDTHISLLRAVMVGLCVPFVEVPPVPAGYDFMACLTHDVDFVGIRDHKFDRTMWGFLYRSTVVSLLKALLGKLSWSKCLRNWAAAASLPLIHLGLREDFWLEFERYVDIERPFGSTFFFLPFNGVAGTLGPKAAPKSRAAKYDISEIKDDVAKLLRNGCDVGLHGIDAWQDVQSARSERSRVREVTGESPHGIRIHWLYWNEGSPEILEQAGFAYDSTFGYNCAIGFRAGTTQAFCPLGAKNLLELPLNIQDSALFYPDRMALSEKEALDACRGLLNSMCAAGGSLTVNWHTRSLSPERLWDEFYAALLKEIQTHHVWFSTAQQIVDWFRKRRALRFDSVSFAENSVRMSVSTPGGRPLPSFVVRMYHPKSVPHVPDMPLTCGYTEVPWSGEDELECVIN